MSKFKVGDRVRIAESSGYYNKGKSNENNNNPHNTCGEVTELTSPDCDGYTFKVNWDNGEANIYRESDLELVQPKPAFKVGHGAICVKDTANYKAGDIALIRSISSQGHLQFNNAMYVAPQSHFTPCPNPPLPHYKERIAHALGADIEFYSDLNSGWLEVEKPAWLEYKYRVAIPDIHAEEREKLQSEIAELQKKLECLGGDLC